MPVKYFKKIEGGNNNSGSSGGNNNEPTISEPMKYSEAFCNVIPAPELVKNLPIRYLPYEGLTYSGEDTMHSTHNITDNGYKVAKFKKFINASFEYALGGILSEELAYTSELVTSIMASENPAYILLSYFPLSIVELSNANSGKPEQDSELWEKIMRIGAGHNTKNLYDSSTLSFNEGDFKNFDEYLLTWEIKDTSAYYGKFSDFYEYLILKVYSGNSQESLDFLFEHLDFYFIKPTTGSKYKYVPGDTSFTIPEEFWFFQYSEDYIYDKDAISYYLTHFDETFMTNRTLFFNDSDTRLSETPRISAPTSLGPWGSPSLWN